MSKYIAYLREDDSVGLGTPLIQRETYSASRKYCCTRNYSAKRVAENETVSQKEKTPEKALWQTPGGARVTVSRKGLVLLIRR